MKWQGVSLLISLAGVLLGIVASVRPQPGLCLTRRRAGIVLAASLSAGAISLTAAYRHHCGCGRPIQLEKRYQRLQSLPSATETEIIQRLSKSRLLSVYLNE
jgi:hypothetical protein